MRARHVALLSTIVALTSRRAYVDIRKYSIIQHNSLVLVASG
jgi:hypothetical protein